MSHLNPSIKYIDKYRVQTHRYSYFTGYLAELNCNLTHTHIQVHVCKVILFIFLLHIFVINCINGLAALIQTHAHPHAIPLPLTNFHFSLVWLGGSASHVSVFWPCAENIWKRCSFVCSWGLLAKLLVKHFGQMEESREQASPPTSLSFGSLP